MNAHRVAKRRRPRHREDRSCRTRLRSSPPSPWAWSWRSPAGFLALKLRLPPLVGYLLAGVAVGPFTPGFVGDEDLAGQLAEIGVILLMFGVGLHFSIRDLMAVRRIAIPGAVGQIAVGTALGCGIALIWGWSFGAGLVFGLALSVASTVVLLRALEERNLLDSANGRIAVGWLIVEDLAMVLALVLLPALAGVLGGDARGLAGHIGGESLGMTLALTLGKVALFLGLVLVVGKRVVPWVLGQAARTGSRELFTLAVLATALGIAYGSAELFGVSFALGAFFAGVVLSETDFSHRAAADSLPLQDAFAVLFFVSVGMLFDPSILVREPLAVLAVLFVIVVGKSVAAFGIVLAFGRPDGDGADGLGQPGPDRRVLLHPRRARHRPGPAAAGRPRPDPGRRAAVDHAQPARLRGHGRLATLAARAPAADGARRSAPAPTARRRSAGPDRLRGAGRAGGARRLRPGRQRGRPGPAGARPADRGRGAGSPSGRRAAWRWLSRPSTATPPDPASWSWRGSIGRG